MLCLKSSTTNGFAGVDVLKEPSGLPLAGFSSISPLYMDIFSVKALDVLIIWSL